MAQRWTPRHFVVMRRIRVAVCAAVVLIASCSTFALTQRKAVALTINGKTTQVVTYAQSVPRLLEEQGVDIKSHDQVLTTSGEMLRNNDVVTVRSAYQTTIMIDGTPMPFWTNATSAEQILGFFEANNHAAERITVNIDDVYNQLTGGFVINESGPVKVIADGKTTVAPNGKLPAASILDSQGITLGKEDRVSVEKDNGETVLRVQRVTHGEETRTETVPFAQRTVVDPSLAPGEIRIVQQGVNGVIERVFSITYVDGEAESESEISQTTKQEALDQVVAIGPEKTESNKTSEGEKAESAQNGDSSNNNSNADNNVGNETKPDNGDNSNNSGNNDNSNQQPEPEQPSKPEQPAQPTQPEQPTQPSQPTQPNQGRLWHPTVAQAQAYAAGAAAQYGWTGDQWDALVWLWNHESSWLWYADNPNSDAYGIPQALPGSKMGDGWQDDGAVQIDWGLRYIAGRYGSPKGAVNYWHIHHWY